jgi:hypothetical protein
MQHWLWLAALLGVIGTAQAADPLPDEFHSEYLLKKGPFTIGRTERSLTALEEGRYRFESITRPLGIAKLFTDGKVEESSVWILHDGQIRPLEYTYFNSGRKKDRHVELHFDWPHNSVTNTINGDPWTMNIEPGTLDKFIYQLAIMMDLKHGREQLSYQIADGGKLKTYAAVIKGKERVSTPLGEFTTVVVEQSDGKRSTTLWCAEQLHYLPVKIGYTEKDGSTFTGILDQLTGME